MSPEPKGVMVAEVPDEPQISGEVVGTERGRRSDVFCDRCRPRGPFEIGSCMEFTWLSDDKDAAEVRLPPVRRRDSPKTMRELGQLPLSNSVAICDATSANCAQGGIRTEGPFVNAGTADRSQKVR
jgi:hypothetical protein